MPVPIVIVCLLLGLVLAGPDLAAAEPRVDRATESGADGRAPRTPATTWELRLRARDAVRSLGEPLAWDAGFAGYRLDRDIGQARLRRLAVADAAGPGEADVILRVGLQHREPGLEGFCVVIGEQRFETSLRQADAAGEGPAAMRDYITMRVVDGVVEVHLRPALLALVTTDAEIVWVDWYR